MKRPKPDSMLKRKKKAQPSFLGYISPDDDDGSHNPENRTPKKDRAHSESENVEQPSSHSITSENNEDEMGEDE